MRHSSFVLLAALLLPTAAAAQTGPQPTLVLTMSVGVVTGHSLWRVSKQPLCVMNPDQVQCSSLYDTLTVSRSIGSSLTGGLSGTLYPSPHIGLQLDVSYLGMSLQNGCLGPATYVSDPAASPDTGDVHRNRQICDNIQASSVAASALGLHAGVVLRAAPRGSLSPYLRVGAGLTSLSRSTVAIEGEFIDQHGVLFSKALIVDARPKETSASYVFGVGLTSSLGPGYQFRLEVRDVLATQSRVDGPATGLGLAPSSSKLYHHIALTMGLDVVLERKRGRRY